MASDGSAERRQIQLACSGDRAAQQSLWRDHRRWVAAIVLAHRPRSIEVDDLMQDVAVRFVSKLETLRDPGAFRPWLRRITINVCRGAARTHRPMRHLSDSASPSVERRQFVAEPEAATTEDGALMLEKRDFARRLLEQAMSLPSDYREPLLLRCVRSMTYQDISDVLDLPVTTIETRLARARRMLREELAREFDPDGSHGGVVVGPQL